MTHLTYERDNALNQAPLPAPPAARRPILNVPGDGVDALLAETQAGESLAALDQIARRLADWCRQWKQTGTVPCQTLPERAAVYSRRDQAGQLAEVFESVVSLAQP